MVRSGRSNYMPTRCLMVADWVSARRMETACRCVRAASSIRTRGMTGPTTVLDRTGFARTVDGGSASCAEPVEHGPGNGWLICNQPPELPGAGDGRSHLRCEAD